MSFIHHLHLLETQVSEHGKQVIKTSVGRMSKKQGTDRPEKSGIPILEVNLV